MMKHSDSLRSIHPRAAGARALTQQFSLPFRNRVLRYTGAVTQATNERILKSIGQLMDKNTEGIGLFITSPGGPTGTAMNFYDTVRHVLRPNLITIGSGDVDSSGVIIFMAGNTRYLTKGTTMLLHPAGRIFGNQRYTTHEMEAMLAEDRLKDQQYASVIAEASGGRVLMEEILTMMQQHTVLTPERAVELGIATAVLPVH